MHMRSLFATAAILSASFMAHADVVNFNFTISGADTASGTFVTSTTSTAGQYLLTGVSGTYNGSSLTVVPAGAVFTTLPPTNDNLIFYPASGGGYVDFSGIGLQDAAGLYINVFYASSVGYVISSGTNPAFPDNQVSNVTVTLSPATVAATPEPSSLMLLATGALGVAGAVRRRLA